MTMWWEDNRQLRANRAKLATWTDKQLIGKLGDLEITIASASATVLQIKDELEQRKLSHNCPTNAPSPR